jgi:hypothetical protein
MTFNLDGTLDLSGIAAMDPSMAGGVATITAKGSGAFSVDLMAADPMNALAAKVDVTGAVVSPDGEEPFDVSIVIVDGMMYGLDRLGDNTWESESLEDALAASGIPMDPSMFSDPSAMLEGMGMGDMGMADMDMSPFVTQQRLADEQIMGQTMYPFETSLDLMAMLLSEEVMGAITEAMSAGAGTGTSDSEMAQMAAMLPMLPMMLGNSSVVINITQWVGADDGYMHKFALNLDAVIDLNTLIAMMGESGGATVDPITLNAVFWVELSDINGAVDIAAPM